MRAVFIPMCFETPHYRVLRTTAQRVEAQVKMRTGRGSGWVFVKRHKLLTAEANLADDLPSRTGL